MAPNVLLCKKKKKKKTTHTHTNIVIVGTVTLAPADGGLNPDNKG
jgi:hypothetical protein